MTSLFSLQGRNAIVTGASRGLGAAAARALAAAGANVALTGRDLAALEREASALAVAHNIRTLPVVCDASDPDAIQRMADMAHADMGPIDILVNNAGIIRRAAAVDYTPDDWNAVIATNQTGVFRTAQCVGRYMIARGSGKIINIASLLAFSGGLNVVAYTAAKHAVAGITKALANEWAPYGVNVNAIAPGYFQTDATEALRNDPERYNALLKRIPAGRWGAPDDLAGTVVYLASRASDYVNGHVLVVDGGWCAA